VSIISYLTIRLINTTGMSNLKIVIVVLTDDTPLLDGKVVAADL